MGLILVTDSDYGDIAVESAVAEEAGHAVVCEQCHDEPAVLAALARHRPDGLLVQTAPITAAAFAAQPSVRAVARYGVGLDTIDLDAARREGVVVRNVVDYGTQEVADHAWALVLALARRLPDRLAATRAGRWPAPAATEPPYEMEGRTLGLVGFGRIARAVARRARASGMRVLASDPHVPSASFSAEGAEGVEWERLWAASDVISLHLPLADGTRGIVGRGELLAPRARPLLLVNVSRGQLVDRDAFERALEAGAVAGAGFDVWWTEPCPPDDPLLADPRVLLTPHEAWRSDGSAPRLRRMATAAVVEELARAGVAGEQSITN